MNFRKILYIFLFLLTLSPIAFADSLSTLRWRTQLLWGIDNDAKFPDSVVDECINMACEALANIPQCYIVKQDTIVLVPETRQYSLNSDCREVLWARYLNESTIEGKKELLYLSKVAPEDLSKKYESKLNLPTQFAQTDKKIEVYRLPLQRDSLLLSYSAIPVYMDTSTDTTLIPNDCQILIPVVAKMYMKVRTGEISEQQIIQFLFQGSAKQEKVDIVAQPEVIK